MTTDTIAVISLLTDTQTVVVVKDTMKLYYTEHYEASDTLTTGKGSVHIGLKSTPMPYRLNTDDGITALLFLCFFLSAYVFTNGKKFLFQQIKDFVHVKERGNLFDKSTAADFRYHLILFFQTSVLIGICFFDYFYDNISELLDVCPPIVIIGISISACIIYYFIKWILYSFIGWIFFDKTQVSMWLEAYSTISYYLGFSLFPVVLLMIYFDLSLTILVAVVLGLVIFAKMLMFYKWIKFFFNNLYGLFCLIAYFCALEILPCLILFQIVFQINNLLLIKL